VIHFALRRGGLLSLRQGGWNQRRCRLPLARGEIALVILSLADGGIFTPVKIQALFLASRKIPDAFTPESRFDFQPYDYGPFDSAVYREIEDLKRDGLAEIGTASNGRWRVYSATPQGIDSARELSCELSGSQMDILTRIVQLVRSLSFNDLVSAIYRAYPDMRERSVFRD
jgi:uncharacterized protein